MIATSRHSTARSQIARPLIARPLIGALLLAGSMAAGTIGWTTWSPALAQERSFSHSGVARDAERYELTLKTQARGAKVDAKAARAAADKALAAKDQRGAAKLLAQIAGAEPANAAHWQALAAALLAIPADSLQGSERYEVPLNASAAAYLATQRAASNDARAAALVVLADGLKRRSMWRPALDAYRASLALADAAPVRAAYEKLLAQGWVDGIRHVHPDKTIYTFWDYMRNRWPRDAGLRIDHLLLSPAVAPRLKDAGVDKAVRGWEGASDHAPAWITLD